MRFICPRDVKKMLLKQVTTAYWKKCASRHECEELSRGVWLDPINALLRRKTNEPRRNKHRNVMRKIVVEGGLVATRMYDTGCSDEKKCRGCDKEDGHGETQGCTISRPRTRSRRVWGTGNKLAKAAKEDWK